MLNFDMSASSSSSCSLDSDPSSGSKVKQHAFKGSQGRVALKNGVKILALPGREKGGVSDHVENVGFDISYRGQHIVTMDPQK